MVEINVFSVLDKEKHENKNMTKNAVSVKELEAVLHIRSYIMSDKNQENS